MSAASRYWTLVRIDAAGKRKIEEIAQAKAFFLASFPEFMPRSEVPDALIQRQLLHWMREAKGQTDTNKRFLSERCLQCFISSQIDRVCQKLATQFGAEHGFTCGDLLPFVLDDDGTTTPASTSYQSLLREIVQSFDPEQSSLATWTTRRVKHHKELNAFLLEHGVYLVSDWAILNDTSPKQLQRIFSEFHHLTPIEIQQAKQLLESYHAVYRAQRLKQRQAGIKGQCLPPTTEQLHKMGMSLSTQTSKRLTPETLMTQLQEMASRLREYRIYVRGGSLPTESLDVTTDTGTLTERIPSLDFADNQDTPDEQTEFLSFYRQQFLTCLDQAVAQVTDERVKHLQRKDAQKAQKFLTALQLFHCQERSMTEIAPEVNLQAQFHVSRLLQLKSFRADVQQQLLVRLRDLCFAAALRYRVFDQAKAYTEPERLQTLNQQIEEALDEQITQVIQEAARSASTATTAKNQTTTSLFAERLCRHLDTRRNSP
ncbi:MAG: hypothetical protein ICV55_07805 [Coleofasciculus sp. C3-bin4]|nr:hypothetical protein [Coleofasciculus sp. C3-bin4]